MGDTMTATTCYIVLSVFFSLCIITAGLRFYTRLCLLRKFSADDYMLLIGILLLVPYTALYAKLIFHLFYRPYEQLSLHTISNIYKYAFIMMPFYLVASIFVKLSIALRVLKFTSEAPVLRWIVIISITLYTIDVLAMLAINFTRCLQHFFPWARPFKVGWGPHCIRPSGFRTASWVFSSMTCFVDFTFAVVAWFVVQRLWTARRRTRIILSILLSLGSIASLATIARMFYTYKFANYPQTPIAGNFYIWLYLELTLATIACGVSTLKPLVTKFVRNSMANVPSEPPRRTTTSSTWSEYLKRYLNGIRGEKEEPSSPENTAPTPANPQRRWPVYIQSSATPRVLEHPLSFESISSMRMNETAPRYSRQSRSQDIPRFNTPSISSDSQNESEGPVRTSRTRVDNVGKIHDLSSIYALPDV